MNKSERAVSGACFCYRKLVALYPRSFRDRFESEMLQVFRAQCRQLGKARGPRGPWRALLSTLPDLATSAIRERLAEFDSGFAVLLGIALAGGLFATYVDYHNNEVQAPVLILLLVATPLGAFRPKQAWIWGLAVGIGIPACHIGGQWLGLRAPYPVQPNVYGSLIAVIPAFIGSYFGRLLRVAIGGTLDPDRTTRGIE
jgi:hypothetical protein